MLKKATATNNSSSARTNTTKQRSSKFCKTGTQAQNKPFVINHSIPRQLLLLHSHHLAHLFYILIRNLLDLLLSLKRLIFAQLASLNILSRISPDTSDLCLYTFRDPLCIFDDLFPEDQWDVKYRPSLVSFGIGTKSTPLDCCGLYPAARIDLTIESTVASSKTVTLLN